MEIDVVIVTFNRLNKLKKTLSCYEEQSMGFRNLIVVNNNSSDGTYSFLEEWKGLESSKFVKKVLHLDNNLGGAGGFNMGQKYALNFNPDWIMVADVDAYPDVDLIGKFHDFIIDKQQDNIAAVCGTVLKINGDIDITHRQILCKKKGVMDT